MQSPLEHSLCLSYKEPFVFDVDFITSCSIKIAASCVCGILLGIERKSHSQVVGLRTLVLISVSSTLLSILSVFMAENKLFPGDPTRIAAGVASGIGFLGGGTIIRQGLNIKGLTSAAIIWAASALGMALGVGLYVQVALVLIVLLILLKLLEKFEWMWFPSERIKTLHLIFSDDDINITEIEKSIKEGGIHITDMNIESVYAEHVLKLHFLVRSPRETDIISLSKKLREIPTLVEFSVTE